MIRALLLSFCLAFSPLIAATASAASIEGPFTVDPGQTVEMMVTGGVSGGRLEIWGPVTQSGRGSVIASGEVSGGSVPVTAPDRSGSYELRYVSPSGALLARRSFEVAAVPVTLSVPQQFGTGIPGLRVLPIQVGPSRTWLRSPIEVFVGEPFPVSWEGPAEPDQQFQLVNPASDSVVSSATPETGPRGLSATLRAPGRPGHYRVRLVNTQTGQVYSDLPLDVDPR